MKQIALDLTLPEPIIDRRPIHTRTAEISKCDRYRYTLTREWGGDDEPTAVFVMLNPSTADADVDDQTIRKCTRYARRWKCGAVYVVNLYAWRATNPRDLPDDELLRVGPHNDRRLSEAADIAAVSKGLFVAAWGANATEQRVEQVLALPGMSDLQCLAVTKDRQPRHPLYLPDDAQPYPWRRGGAR